VSTSPEQRLAEVALLRQQVAAATTAASEAFRDSARLVRLLEVIGEPAPPGLLVDRVLGVLSETFSADLTYLVRAVDGTVEVVGACGFGDSGSAAAPAVPGREALYGEGQPATWACPAGQEPPVVGGVPVVALLHVPLAEGDPGAGALVLTRSGGAAFTPGELHLLRSVASRLRSSLEDGQRRVAVERLARAGHRLTRHLHLQPLLEEAVGLLREVTDAGWAAAVLVEDGLASLAAQDRMPPQGVLTWPRRTEELTAWPAALRGDVHHDPDLAAGALPPALRLTARSLLCVPVLHEGVPVALLYAAHARPAAFSPAAVEAAALFAGYVGAALVNAHLYRALAGSETRLRVVTDAITDLVAVVDAGGTVTYASPSYARQVAHEPADLVGTDLAALVHPEDLGRFLAGLRAAPLASTCEHRLLDGQGRWVWVESGLGPAPGAAAGVVVSSRLVGERRRLEDELRQRATHDSLTGLANRDLARQVLESSLRAQRPGMVGLLFCDLDEFKSVNDRLGHEAGDDLLRQVARRLRACVRPEDLLARLGGDEFVIVLGGTTGLDAVTAVGDRVQEAMSAPFALGRERVRVGVSIGGVVGRRGPHGDHATDLLRDADAAMYEAKRGGRGRVEVFDGAAARRSVERLTLRSDLLSALERGQLEVHYQAIVDLTDGATTGFEALLRWHHPDLGPVSPVVFVPLAEETGAITEIGAWVLEQACTELAAWQRMPGGERLSVSVNVSPVQLEEPTFAERVLDVVARTGVSPREVWLEVTEGVAVTEHLLGQLHGLRRAGVRLALDDFGTSYSNLGYLKALPVERLKVDRSFVAGLGDESGAGHGVDVGIVRAVLAIADAAGLSVVAEGIETAAQQHALLELGCLVGQGFLFARPVPAGQARRTLADQLERRRERLTASPAASPGAVLAR